MIRETYQGRELKILKSSTPGHVKQVVGGRIVNNRWQGSEQQAIENLRDIIDRLDDNGPGHIIYEAPHWWPLATDTGAAS